MRIPGPFSLLREFCVSLLAHRPAPARRQASRCRASGFRSVSIQSRHGRSASRMGSCRAGGLDIAWGRPPKQDGHGTASSVASAPGVRMRAIDMQWIEMAHYLGADGGFPPRS
jgi:hypothetical protein